MSSKLKKRVENKGNSGYLILVPDVPYRVLHTKYLYSVYGVISS